MLESSTKWFGERIFESMLIDKALLDELTEKAKASPRLRANYDLRDSADDESPEQGDGYLCHRKTKSVIIKS